MKQTILKTSFFILTLVLFAVIHRAQATPQPPIQLATTARSDIDIRQYWVSEKLDGVRAYWDGKQLISRQGNVFAAPTWFTADFPAQPMDGELWIARDQFDLTSGIVRQKTPNKDQWRKITFMIFDLPNAGGDFSYRVAKMHQLTQDINSAYLKMIPQFKLASHAELEDMLTQVVAGGGEGLMLHRSGAIYRAGRSIDVMKVKRYQDEEAVVLKHLPGKGKYRSMMGALLVKNDDGVVFKIGSGFSDLERQNPPPVGAQVSYKFFGKTKNNKPRFASFLRVRSQE